MVVGPAVGDDDEVGRRLHDIDAAGDDAGVAVLLEGPAAAGIVAAVARGAFGRVAGALEDLRDALSLRVEVFLLDVGTVFVLIGAAGLDHELLIPVVVALEQHEGKIVIDHVRLDVKAEVLLIVDAGGLLRGFAGGTQRGQQQRRQDRDDGDHDQEFDKGEMTLKGAFDGHFATEPFGLKQDLSREYNHKYSAFSVNSQAFFLFLPGKSITD